MLKPTKGKLLIAEPSILNDPSFNRSVVLLTEHNEEGTVGFILNKLSRFKLNELVPEILIDFPVYIGGPVEPENLYFIHKKPELIVGSIEIGKGFYWGGNIEIITKLVNNAEINPDEIRFFLGYSGWEIDQLNEELEVDSWVVVENDFPNILNADDTTLWKNQMIQLGGNYLIWANAPVNPSLN
ncbi:MAG: YqgE/AlgH family protein [Flavobacteriaceae bacterium]|jgi:putative transcriptional regulator|nr:YqgE/AlgH family protein [Flavobacteriaceae bacterium]